MTALLILASVTTSISAPAPELLDVGPAPAAYALIHLSGDGVISDPIKYRRAQAGHVRQPRVLQAALKSPGVLGLPLVKNLRDPEAWLKDNLKVEWTQAEVLRIGLNDGPPEQLAVLVDAMADAYVLEWVELMRAARVKMLSGLQADVRQKEELLAESRKSLDKPLQAESLELLRKDLASRESALKAAKDYCDRIARAVEMNLPKVAVVRKASIAKVKE